MVTAPNFDLIVLNIHTLKSYQSHIEGAKVKELRFFHIFCRCRRL